LLDRGAYSAVVARNVNPGWLLKIAALEALLEVLVLIITKVATKAVVAKAVVAAIGNPLTYPTSTANAAKARAVNHSHASARDITHPSAARARGVAANSITIVEVTTDIVAKLLLKLLPHSGNGEQQYQREHRQQYLH
jgi:hypothetical protein